MPHAAAALTRLAPWRPRQTFVRPREVRLASTQPRPVPLRTGRVPPSGLRPLLACRRPVRRRELKGTGRVRRLVVKAVTPLRQLVRRQQPKTRKRGRLAAVAASETDRIVGPPFGRKLVLLTFALLLGLKCLA